MAYAGPTWDDTLAQYGTANDRHVQGAKKRLATDRLLNLTRQQQQSDTSRAQTRGVAVPYGALPKSGFLGEFDYRQNMNREGEIADLTSRLSGKGPARVQSGGTIGGGGMGPATRALQRQAGGDDGVAFNAALGDDTLDFQTRTIQRDRMLGAANEDVAESLRASGDYRAKTDPFEARRRGDIGREEAVRNATTAGEADVAAYLAPRAAEVRRQRLWDKEAEQKALAPYTPSIINSQNRLEGQRVGADARVGAAEIGGDARVGSAGIAALGRLGSAPTFTPEDRAARDAATDTIRPTVPGGRGGGPGPAGGGQAFPRAKLAAFAREKGFESEQAAAEYLAQMGYAVR